MKPTVVSEFNNYDVGRFSATRALTNTDKRGTANWMGRNRRRAHFVYDLGCKALIKTLVLRNSCNGARRDRLVQGSA